MSDCPGTLVLRPRCHPDARVIALVPHGQNLVEIRCAVCSRFVIRLELAPDGEAIREIRRRGCEVCTPKN